MAVKHCRVGRDGNTDCLTGTSPLTSSRCNLIGLSISLANRKIKLSNATCKIHGVKVELSSPTAHNMATNGFTSYKWLFSEIFPPSLYSFLVTYVFTISLNVHDNILLEYALHRVSTSIFFSKFVFSGQEDDRFFTFPWHHISCLRVFSFKLTRLLAKTCVCYYKGAEHGFSAYLCFYIYPEVSVGAAILGTDCCLDGFKHTLKWLQAEILYSVVILTT